MRNASAGAKLAPIKFGLPEPDLVIEPETELEVNQAWADWDGAVKAMDEMGEAAPRIAKMFEVAA